MSTARIDTIASADRSSSNATHYPGPAPSPISRCANRFDDSSAPGTSTRPSNADRHRVRNPGDLLGEQPRNRRPGSVRPGQHRPVARSHRGGPAQHHRTTRPPTRPPRSRSTPPTPAHTARWAPRSGPIEQVTGVLDRPRQIPDDHRPRASVRTIETSDPSGHFVSAGKWLAAHLPTPLRGRTVDLPGEVLQGKRHLEQRMIRRRAGRIQQLHQPLERRILILVRRQLPYAPGRAPDRTADSPTDPPATPTC